MPKESVEKINLQEPSLTGYPYPLWKAIRDLDGFIDDREANLVQQYYIQYDTPSKRYRFTALHELSGKFATEDIQQERIRIKGIAVPNTKQEKGGHGNWIARHRRRTVIRILFLRAVFERGLSRVQANQELLPIFGSNKAETDGGASGIREATRSRAVNLEIKARKSKR